MIQKERIKEVENKNPGVELVAAPREERRQAAAVLVSSKKIIILTYLSFVFVMIYGTKFK